MKISKFSSVGIDFRDRIDPSFFGWKDRVYFRSQTMLSQQNVRTQRKGIRLRSIRENFWYQSTKSWGIQLYLNRYVNFDDWNRFFFRSTNGFATTFCKLIVLFYLHIQTIQLCIQPGQLMNQGIGGWLVWWGKVLDRCKVFFCFPYIARCCQQNIQHQCMPMHPRNLEL